MDQALFQSDDAVTRTKLYLRILYAKDYLIWARTLSSSSDALPELTRRLVASIDFDLMELEQSARARNLGRHVTRAAPALQHSLSPDLFALILADFTNSDAFWVATGRSLTENFCLFAHGAADHQLTPFQKDTVKASGIVAGLSVAPESYSPWAMAGQSSKLDGGEAVGHCETFVSKLTLVDGAGELATQDNLNVVQTEAHSRIFVQCLSDRSVVAYSVTL